MEKREPMQIVRWIAGGVLLLLALLFLGRLVTILLPFALAWGLAFLVRPIACAIAERTGIPRRIASVSLTVLAFAGFGTGVFLIGSRLWQEAGTLLAHLAEHPETLSGWVSGVSDTLQRLRELLPGIGGEALLTEEELLDMIREGLSSAVGTLSRTVGTLLLRLPAVLFFCLVTVIAAVYFASDLSEINQGLLALLPPRLRELARRLKRGIMHGAAIYLRAYAILFCLTFLCLAVGFLLLGIRYPWLVAFLCAVVDLLPILGVGTVLIPWGLFLTLTGRLRLGLCLLALWLILTVLRRIAEPHLLGKGLGLHPLLALLAMYAGYVLGGVTGILIAPPIAALLCAMLRWSREGSVE